MVIRQENREFILRAKRLVLPEELAAFEMPAKVWIGGQDEEKEKKTNEESEFHLQDSVEKND